MKYLLLWLDGPLQSWGTDSKFDFRKTMPFPSQSGVFGMLLAASGDSGPQEELLAQMAEAPFSVITFKDKTRMLLDFHMVGNGYDEKDPWETLHILKKADGKPRQKVAGVKITYREFLQNRTFAVILGLQDNLADKFANALQTPVYDLYLGRKCCPPTSMIFHGIFDSEQNAVDALKKILNEEPEQRHIPDMIYQTDPQHSDPAAILVNDVPVRFGKHKLYRDRWVSQKTYDL